MVNWPSYNQSLVRRGQVPLDFDVFDGWDNELVQMNRGKVGEPYDYPNSFIQLLGYMRAYFHLPYRQTQGVDISLMQVLKYHAYQIIVPSVDV